MTNDEDLTSLDDLTTNPSIPGTKLETGTKIPKEQLEHVDGYEEVTIRDPYLLYRDACNCRLCEHLRAEYRTNDLDARPPTPVRPTTEANPNHRIANRLGDHGEVLVVKADAELKEVYKSRSGKVKASTSAPPSVVVPEAQRPQYEVYAKFTRSYDNEGQPYYRLANVYAGGGPHPWMRQSKAKHAMRKQGATHKLCTTALSIKRGGRIYTHEDLDHEMERLVSACSDACNPDLRKAANDARRRRGKTGMFSSEELDRFAKQNDVIQREIKKGNYERRAWRA